jgi:hypothetical protein
MDNFFDSQNLKVVKDILFRQVENEGILLHVPSGNYYSLSETSLLFWNALSNQQPLEALVDKIIEEYEVDRDRVLRDLQVFLQDLIAYGIIFPASD